MSRVEHLAEGDRWVTIYALCEPIDKWRTGPVRYVGKTINVVWHRVRAHAYAAKRHAPRLPVHRWLRKHIEAGDPFHIRHLEVLPPGADWEGRERHWIAKFRDEGADLLNLTDGGEGLAGRRQTTDHRQKIAAALRTGAEFTCEVCATPFWRKQRDIARGHCRFCSRHCYQVWQRGKSKGGAAHVS